jgi:hypothetical protein
MCVSMPSMKCSIYVVLTREYEDTGFVTLYATAGSVLC